MMAGGKKRKVDAEGRQFQQKWTEEFFFILHNGICLLCKESIQVMKEFNIKSHLKVYQNKIGLWEAQMLSGNSYHLTMLYAYKNIVCAPYAEELKLL
ncbi:General transcription factor II-I repeat domain-containing protein 2 [Eumeta japonica]|uniref:General transcription factor II-I repeat domain-containing protein 2 n=1 Tax=Eumeta variegata TaxID=151549 RepID=A0A4C1T5P5_EUMVA|nr:General transcription factor II-I repeat domain-containing protein 2 [Eumeta japonica]